MATYGYNLILALACTSTLMYGIICKPVKRSATDCYGTDCIIPQDELDFHSNPRDTELLENITGSVVHALPEITDLLKNIVFVNQNTTIPTLPLISQSLEDDKNLQTYQNLLIENGTAVTTHILLEMVRLMQSQQDFLQDHAQRQNQLLEDQAERQDQLLNSVASTLPLLTDISYQIQQQNLPYSCLSLTSGQHTILPKYSVLGSFPVVCDMDTDGGGWIVFQRRFNGSVDFDRVWNDYVNGFGSLSGEFWLGLNKLYDITSRGRWEMRVDLEGFDGEQAYAIYDHFRIGDSASFYRLNIGSYSGTAGDSMRSHDLNGMAFTTKNQDHDRRSGANCAILYQGAGWHNGCTHANLNGLYLGQDGTSFTGMHWYKWKNNRQSLKKSELKIRLTDG